MKRILITGGAGFIGSSLCEKLAEDPNNIIYSLDNYSTGSKANPVFVIFSDNRNAAEKII